jgi:DNA (cytosine-5)-methyltransferase 1
VGWGVVELFAGIGNVARAFAATGSFDSLLLTDIDGRARDTVLANEPTARYLVRDAARLRSADLLRAADGRTIAGILGCPPCQGFSAAGRRDVDDPRNGLMADYFRAVLQMNPAFFVAENVPAVYQSRLLARILAIVDRRYDVWRGVVNAALFGVPQTRQRAILIGYRRDLGIRPGSPTTTHLGRRPIFNYRTMSAVRPDRDALSALLGQYPQPWPDDPLSFEPVSPSGRERRRLVTVDDAIGDLPPAGANEFQRDRSSSYAAGLRSGEELSNHEAWRHAPDQVERFRKIEEGAGPVTDSGRRYYSGAYARLHRHGLARTITTNFHNAGSGRFLHPTEPRTLTVREAARLQGIGDGFRFVGDRSVQEIHVGNSFPPPLAAAIARRVSADLARAGY